MSRRARLPWLAAGTMLLALLGGGVALWVQRTPILARYYVYRLTRATDADRNAWIDRALSLNAAAVPALFDRLRADEARTSFAAATALARYAERARADAECLADLAGRLADGFAERGTAGQRYSLDLGARLLTGAAGRGELPPALAENLGRLAGAAAEAGDAASRARALTIAARLAELCSPAALPGCQAAARAGLRDGDAAHRVRAIDLAAVPGVGLVAEVVPLLRDPVADVRRAAILLLGPAQEAVSTDDLLCALHDADPTVRRLTETALRGRGLSDEHVKLGRMISDPRPEGRLEVLGYLRQTTDLEPGVWLRRLSQDAAPAVRAAAVRAAGEQLAASGEALLTQAAQSDPSPTVRQIARYYLASRDSSADR